MFTSVMYLVTSAIWTSNCYRAGKPAWTVLNGVATAILAVPVAVETKKALDKRRASRAFKHAGVSEVE